MQESGRPRPDSQPAGGVQVARGVDVPAQPRPVAVQRGRPAGGVRRRRAGAEARGQCPGARRQQRRPGAGGVRHERAGQRGGGGRAAVSSAGRSAGRSEDSAATGPGSRRWACSAPWASAAFRPLSGSSPTVSAPSPATSAAACGSSVTTRTRRTAGLCSAAATVSPSSASTSSPCPVGSSSVTAVSRVLAATRRLAGTTTDHCCTLSAHHTADVIG